MREVSGSFVLLVILFDGECSEINGNLESKDPKVLKVRPHNFIPKQLIFDFSKYIWNGNIRIEKVLHFVFIVIM